LPADQVPREFPLEVVWSPTVAQPTNGRPTKRTEIVV
jgi:hypothetical protein